MLMRVKENQYYLITELKLNNTKKQLAWNLNWTKPCLENPMALLGLLTFYRKANR